MGQIYWNAVYPSLVCIISDVVPTQINVPATLIFLSDVIISGFKMATGSQCYKIGHLKMIISS